MARKNRTQQPGFSRKEPKRTGAYGPMQPDPETIEMTEEEGDLERPVRALIPFDKKGSAGPFGDERSDRESGRPVQLETQGAGSREQAERDQAGRHDPGRGAPRKGRRADREPGSQQAGQPKK